MGALFLTEKYKEAFFDKAKKIRYLINERLKKIFQKGDIILLPVSGPAPLVSTKSEKTFTVSSIYDLTSTEHLLANFLGSPAIVLPIGMVDNLPISISVFSDQYQEATCLEYAHKIEKIVNFSNKFKNDIYE